MEENMRNRYDISVIIPIYNAENYIEQCLDSLVRQTKDKLEIIAVNDGSTDGTAEILSKYAEQYHGIKIINKENGGLASARIAGLHHASGTYIGWVDADDFIDSEMFQVLFALAEDNKADYVYCNYEFFPKKIATKEKWFKPYRGTRNWRFIERNTQCWNTLTRKELLDAVDLAEKYLQYEEYAWIAVMLAAKKICYTENAYYYYRVGNNTMSGGSFKGKLSHFAHCAELAERLPEMIQGTRYEGKINRYFEYRWIYTLLQLQIVSAVNKSKSEYQYAGERLRNLCYRSNPYTKKILDHNHGKLKSFVIRNVIPSSYHVACAVTKLVFH